MRAPARSECRQNCTIGPLDMERRLLTVTEELVNETVFQSKADRQRTGHIDSTVRVFVPAHCDPTAGRDTYGTELHMSKLLL